MTTEPDTGAPRSLLVRDLNPYPTTHREIGRADYAEGANELIDLCRKTDPAEFTVQDAAHINRMGERANAILDGDLSAMGEHSFDGGLARGRLLELADILADLQGYYYAAMRGLAFDAGPRMPEALLDLADDVYHWELRFRGYSPAAIESICERPS